MNMTQDAIFSTDNRRRQEQELVCRLRDGDADAAEELVREFGPRMLAIAARFFKCPQDRDDAVQDAFISAFRAIHNFDGDSRLATWLHRVTVNACLMKLRARSRRHEMTGDELLPRFAGQRPPMNRLVEWEQDGHSHAVASELRSHVRACIDRLPEPYRVVLLLRDIEGLDTDQTAQAMQCTAANVKTRLHRARHALRSLLEPLYGEPEPDHPLQAQNC
jgi:RNA polymerase sigma-70 factor (ECF subfamily)